MAQNSGKPDDPVRLQGDFVYELSGGENPYQIPASFFSTASDDPLGLVNFSRVSGDPPCFTNLANADCLVHTLCLAAEAFRQSGNKKVPYLAIAAKHGNACGMGVSWDDSAKAVELALWGNPRSVWGGEFIINFAVDSNLANMLHRSAPREQKLGIPHWMLDLVMAADFTQEAVEILGQRPRRKLLQNSALSSPGVSSTSWSYRQVRGGLLRQPPNNYILDLEAAVLEGGALDHETFDSLVIAWSAAWSSNHGGNEIAITRDRQLLGCAGGPSTVEAAETAVARARSCGHHLTGGVFAANAFFPFTDAPEILVGAGLQTGVVPSGGQREAEVRSFFNQRNLSAIYLPEQFRGFSRH